MQKWGWGYVILKKEKKDLKWGKIWGDSREKSDGISIEDWKKKHTLTRYEESEHLIGIRIKKWEQTMKNEGTRDGLKDWGLRKNFPNIFIWHQDANTLLTVLLR